MSGFLDVPPQPTAIVITEDGGGLVEKYREAAYQYRLEGRQVKILGSCRSACILALSVPDVCVGPEAVIMAHHAYGLYSGKIKPDTTKAILDELPDNISRVIGPNIRKEYNEGATLTYGELRALGVPKCDREASTPRTAIRKPDSAVARDPFISRILNMFMGSL